MVAEHTGEGNTDKEEVFLDGHAQEEQAKYIATIKGPDA
jgi:hypothetical protein